MLTLLKYSFFVLYATMTIVFHMKCSIILQIKLEQQVSKEVFSGASKRGLRKKTCFINKNDIKVSKEPYEKNVYKKVKIQTKSKKYFNNWTINGLKNVLKKKIQQLHK